jgi:hypothetical protein
MFSAIMETICDPCSEKNKRLVAEKYCSDCEKKLCTECTELHLRRKAFRSHHVIDLSCFSNVPESKDEFLTSFEAESKGKTDSQDLWLSERQALQHKTSC